VKNKDKGRDHKEGESRSVRESQKFYSTSFSKLVMVRLERSLSDSLYKNTKFDVHLNLCTEMCYHSQYILLLCSVQNLLKVQGTLLSCTCWWFASIQSFCVSVYTLGDCALGFVLVEKLPVWGAFVH
jgi:hypothetical protein